MNLVFEIVLDELVRRMEYDHAMRECVLNSFTVIADELGSSAASSVSR